MKRFVSVLFLSLFAVICLHAQPAEKLTNSTIIKMVKAKLSDDLIIEEINNSEVNFNVSPDSIKYLSSKKVSFSVLKAMKAATDTQINFVPGESSTNTNPVEPEQVQVPAEETTREALIIQTDDPVKQPESEQPVTNTNDSGVQPVTNRGNDMIMKPGAEQLPARKEEPSIQSEPIQPTESERGNDNPNAESEVSVTAMSYVIPVTELMTFFDGEFNALTVIIHGWNQRIRNSLENGRQIKENITDVDQKLTDKKNADSKGFTNEIVLLKSQLSNYRAGYKKYKSDMLTDGATITKELKDLGSEADRSISSKFSKVSTMVKSANPDPSAELTKTKAITIPKQKVDDNVINYVSPAAEMLIFYQNEIKSIRDIILVWNEDVISVNRKDAELNNQLEPLNKELMNYQLNPKQNKLEINALKKQCATIEKAKKLVSQKIEKDSKDLSKYLDVIGKELQNSVKERFTDIIDHVNYSFQEDYSGS